MEAQAELLESRVDMEVGHWPRGKSRGDERATKCDGESDGKH